MSEEKDTRWQYPDSEASRLGALKRVARSMHEQRRFQERNIACSEFDRIMLQAIKERSE